MTPIKHLFTLIFLLAFAALFAPILQAQPVGQPNLTVFLERWDRHFKPVNEYCLNPSICGAPNSSLPNKKTITSLYEKFDNGSTNKERVTLNVSAPVYHSQSTITEKMITASNGVSAGFMNIVTSSDGGLTSSSSSFPLASLQVGEQFAYGRLHADITNAAGTAINKMESFESSIAKVGIQGGTEGFEFTYLLPFQVVEKTWNSDGTALITVGVVLAPEISFISGMERTVMDLGNGISGIMFKVLGGGGWRTHDITPACFRPYYHYNFLPPALIDVKPVKPDGGTNNN